MYVIDLAANGLIMLLFNDKKLSFSWRLVGGAFAYAHTNVVCLLLSTMISRCWSLTTNPSELQNMTVTIH